MEIRTVHTEYSIWMLVSVQISFTVVPIPGSLVTFRTTSFSAPMESETVIWPLLISLSLLSYNKVKLQHTIVWVKVSGGSNPIFAHGKMCVFPFFPMGKNGEKSIWKEREMNTFFPIFPHGEKWENTHFSMGKNGVGPPSICHFSGFHFIEFCPPAFLTLSQNSAQKGDGAK